MSLAAIAAALHAHGTSNAAVAGEGFLCIVNLTYLHAEFLVANGRLLHAASACAGG